MRISPQRNEARRAQRETGSLMIDALVAIAIIAIAAVSVPVAMGSIAVRAQRSTQQYQRALEERNADAGTYMQVPEAL